MESVLMLAIVTGLWYWFAAGLAGYTLFSTLKSPLFIGFGLGLLWGDVTTGMIVGASIEMVYLGMVAAGGNIPSDKCLAALIAIPVALQTGVNAEVAVSIAVPLGGIGVLVNNLRRTGNAVLVHKADKYAEEGNTKGIWRCATLYSLIFGFVLRFPIVFVCNLFGADLVQSLLDVIPQWLMNGLTVMGGILPALGFATTIFTIGKNKFLPMFIIGFFMVQYFEISITAAATEVNKTRVLTKKDVTKTYLRWWWTAELSNSFERMQALAVCASFTPALEKLYKKKEDLVDALKRHLQFFNTQAIWGGLIHGTVLAMEEEKATEGKIPGEVISGVKNGLMGPLAGIGDTLDFGTFQTIFLALGASFGAEGSVIGAFFPIMFSILLFCEGYYLFHLGYSLGRDSIKKILSGGIVNKIIDGASILGMFMMGALSATTVKLSTPLSFDIGGKAIVVQDTLNMIAPGLLPLGVVFFVYWGMKYKKWTITKLLVILVVAALVGSFIGIF